MLFIKAFMMWLLMLASPCLLAKTYTLYSYHSDPPFYMPEQPVDLTRAWVKRFNETQSAFKLALKHIDRPTLNTLVKTGEPYLILWANPLWFRSKDPNVKATTAIFWDADIWVSTLAKPVHYESPPDLVGRTIGARTGYYYKGVNELVSQDKITRVNQLNDHDNLQALNEGKVDAYVMSRSSYLYWQATGIDTAQLFIAISAHDAYTRHVLYSPSLTKLAPVLNQFVKEMNEDIIWTKRLKYWGVENLVNPFELELDDLQNTPIQ